MGVYGKAYVYTMVRMLWREDAVYERARHRAHPFSCTPLQVHTFIGPWNFRNFPPPPHPAACKPFFSFVCSSLVAVFLPTSAEECLSIMYR